MDEELIEKLQVLQDGIDKVKDKVQKNYNKTKNLENDITKLNQGEQNTKESIINIDKKIEMVKDDLAYEKL